MEKVDFREIIPCCGGKGYFRFCSAAHHSGDLDSAAKYVWAIGEDHFTNFLTPRNCPRVCYKANDHTTAEDIEKYIGTSSGQSGFQSIGSVTITSICHDGSLFKHFF